MTLKDRLRPILNASGRLVASIAAAFGNGNIIDEAHLGHGYIDPTDAAQHLPVTPDTKFRVASISKLVATLLLQLDPLREEIHRQLMRLFAHNGQRSAALQQYKSCRQIYCP